MTAHEKKKPIEMFLSILRVGPWLAPCLIAALAGASITSAATIPVDTTDPSINADGSCSLIEAISNANDDAPTHSDCVAGNGADTIELAAAATYTLTTEFGSDNGLPLISSEFTINGHDSILERDPAAVESFRILEVAFDGNLTLNDLTIQNGQADGPEPWGGGIRVNGGTLTLNGCTVRNNSAEWAGGIEVSVASQLSLIASEVSDNTAQLEGGGIASDPNTLVTLTGSRISKNTARAGGGINAYGDLFLVRSQVTENTASPWSGGGISTGGTGSAFTILSLVESTVSKNTSSNAGGGILFCVGEFEMVRSTVSGNTAGAADESISVGGGIALCDSRTMTIENSTISGNQVLGTTGTHPGEGGAIALVSFAAINTFLTITDSTIAANTATQGGQAISAWVSGTGLVEARFGNTIIDDSLLADNCRTDGIATIVSNDNNLSSDLTCGLLEANDIENTSAMLAPLGSNGGPTQTHGLLAASPAIDTGATVGFPTTDQRGYPRPFGSQCDKGALEDGYDSYIFLSGFESGDTSAWSNTTP